MIYFGVWNDTETGPLRPIFNKPLKVAQIDMQTMTDVKPVETFWENDQRLEFYPFVGAKCPKLGLWGPYPQHV